MVDMKRLFAEAPQVQQVREDLDREFRPRNEALLADEERLFAMESGLENPDELTTLERQSLQTETANLRRSIQRRREDLQEEIRFRTNSETTALEATIALAVDEVAKSGQYDLILTGPVAYASDRFNITDEVLEWLSSDAEVEAQTP